MNLIWKDLWRPSSWREPGALWQSCRRSWPCSRTACSPSPPCRPGRAAGPSWRSQSQSWNRDHHAETTRIKKKIKFSSYIRKFRMGQLQSHIWLMASSYMGKFLRISSYCIRKPSYMTLQLHHSKFPYIWGEFSFLFYLCMVPLKARQQLYPIKRKNV